MSCTLRYFFPFCLSLLFSTLLKSQTNPSDYEQHLEQRDSLLKLDSLLYFDVDESLSPKEKLLNNQLKRLQQNMLADYKANHFFPPSRNFYQSKEHIESTTLFRFINKMPKGGILHLHIGAIGDADWILHKAWDTPEMYVYWSDDNQKVKGAFQAFKKEDVPEGFVQVKELVNRRPESYQEMRSLLVFEEEMNADSVDIWKEFELIFARINMFINYAPIYEDYLVHGLQLLAEDNIQHAELRGPFLDVFYDLDNERGTLGIKAHAETYDRISERIKAIDPAFTFKVIHCSLRFKDRPAIWNEMEKVYAYRKQYPELVKGFDMVAEEDAGYSTLYHAKEYLRLDSLEKKHGVDLPLYLHDGESNWPSESNLYDAVLLDTKRIGHGFNLFRFPALLDLVKQRDIPMEINPLSNQILGYIRDLRNHPASTYLRRGINCTINSDDPLIFDYHGLSYDFWSVFLAWELDLASLKKLTRNSIEYSVLDEDEKVEALRVWEKRWEGFIADVVKENLLFKQ